MHQHLVGAHRGIVEELTELLGLLTALGQRMQAHGRPLLQGRQQCRAHLAPPRIAKAAKVILLCHANRHLLPCQRMDSGK